jgi:16S rRNA (adenine1518-N6/adenine1519-N6)-dimethyltransferase
MVTSRTRAILDEYGYRPKKGRGQHFLTRESVLRRIVTAARIRPGETLVEIGPGPGNLTRHLLRLADRVIAIEVERELCSILKAEVKADNLTVIEANVLDLEFREFAPTGQKLKVVANLPYNITTPVIFKLLETPEIFSEALVLVQQEVAERITASPGKKPYGILAAQCQLLADCQIALEVGRHAFTPRPKVNSSLLRIKMLAEPRAQVDDPDAYRRIVRAAFAKRRKTLKNSFSTRDPEFSNEQLLAALEKAGIDSSRRAETVTVEEFAALANALAPGGGEQ